MAKASHLRVVPDLPATSTPAAEPAPALVAFIASFRLSLRSEDKSPSTVRTYTDATVKLAAWLTGQGVTSWDAVEKKHLQTYMVWFINDARRPDGKPYTKTYANNQYRAIQQFWKWWAEEEGEPNPMLGMKPPKPEEKVVPVFTEDELAALLRQCEKGKDFESRRDTALLRMFASTGCRLTELTMLTLDDINLEACTAKVMGKGGKERVVKFDLKCAKALDRYINRARVLHKLAARTPRLWLGIMNRQPMTPNGVRQVIERRGEAVGLDIHPHMFRHNFTHRWLDAGGAEGDLMELNGWDSPQMLRRYGRSARSARARRAYDRVNVMGDI